MAPVFQPPGLENLNVVVVVHFSEKTHFCWFVMSVYGTLLCSDSSRVTIQGYRSLLLP